MTVSVAAAALHVAPASAEREGAASLTEADLAPVVAAALTRLSPLVSAAVRETLAQVQVSVADLPAGLLGQAGQGHVWLDRNAAGLVHRSEPCGR